MSPSPSQNELALAWQLHQAGRNADAARRYHALLAREPNNADALHLFGVLHLQQGYFTRAAELLARAVMLRPENAAFHANLAEVYRNDKRPELAIASCRAALKLKPNYPEAANNLGLALHDLGRYAEAVQQFHAALAMKPDFALAKNNLGTTLRELGQAEQAFEAFQAAVEMDPTLARAHSNLSQMLLDQGEFDQALTHALEAVQLDPAFAAGHNNLGNVYRALERWAEADVAYDEALRLAPELAQVHANRGLSLFLQNKRGQAFQYFHQAVKLAPENPEAWRYLANGYTLEENFSAALPCWEKVVALQPSNPTGHSDLGWALQEEGRVAEAAASYQRALELRPDHLDALLNLGHLNEELGDLKEAESYYRKARTAHAWSPAPLARLVTLLRGKLPDNDEQAIRDKLARLGPQAPPRAPLLFGLAMALDARGDHAGAAACLREGNALALHLNEQQGRKYDPDAHSAFVDRLIAGFSRELFERLPDAGDPTRQPIFVFGMPRSGTTLVEQVLASHSRVHGAGELRLARQGFESIPEVLGREDTMQACLEVLDAASVATLAQRHRDGLRKLLEAAGVLLPPPLRGRVGVGGESSAKDPHPTPTLPHQGGGSQREPERIVDKMPDNYLYLGFLALLFPKATFLYVRRDRRDVATSCWMTNFRSIRWANSIDHLARRIRDHSRIMDHWKTGLPVPVHEVVYERLVDDFEPEARRLIELAGLEWEPACLRFHQTARPVRTASVTQVRQPLYRTALARWKRYENELSDLFARLPM